MLKRSESPDYSGSKQSEDPDSSGPNQNADPGAPGIHLLSPVFLHSPASQNQRNLPYILSFRPKARWKRAEAEESISILSPSPQIPIWPALPKNHSLYYAKQTQFLQGRDQRNLLCHTDLHQYSAPLRPKKQTQTNPNKPNLSRRSSQRSRGKAEIPTPRGRIPCTQDAIRHPTYDIRNTNPTCFLSDNELK